MARRIRVGYWRKDGYVSFLAKRKKNMNSIIVTITLTKAEQEHLIDHTFYDDCNVVANIMKRIQTASKKVDK